LFETAEFGNGSYLVGQGEFISLFIFEIKRLMGKYVLYSVSQCRYIDHERGGNRNGVYELKIKWYCFLDWHPNYMGGELLFQNREEVNFRSRL
jgi:hypothetical protein